MRLLPKLILMGLVPVIFSGPSLQGKEVKLEDLTPVATEFGMSESVPEAWQMQKGAGFIDEKPYGGVTQKHWPEASKTVKSYAKNFTIKEGETYSSSMTDVFAVGGELVTGVGLWARNVCAYHWIEYEIPKGAKSFEAEVMIADDTHGISFHRDVLMNWLSFLNVEIDGKKAASTSVNRMGVVPGSGFLVESLRVPIPEKAKKIRFYLESMPLDNNTNNELVIHKGRFIVP